MFSLKNNLKFITINQDYLKILHSFCGEVYYKPTGLQYEASRHAPFGRSPALTSSFCIVIKNYNYAIIENTIANNATDSHNPTTIMYCANPFPVSPNASEPAAPAFP